MHLIFNIIFATILGFLCFIAGPMVGGVLTFGLVVGLLFRAVFLLSEVHRKISQIVPDQSKAEKVYEEYLKERENR